MIRIFSLFFILIIAVLGKNESFCADMLVLPRKGDELVPFQIQEIRFAGQKACRIVSEHFNLTAFTQEEGIMLGKKLEHLHNVWTLLYEQYLRVHIKTESKPVQHRVILYRNKEEFIKNLRRTEPFIERINGFYSSKQKTSYFYSLEEKIIFHEGTHQILSERYFSEANPSFDHHFWMVEGIALFMQTLKIESHRYIIGDILADRLFSARAYQFKQHYHLSIRELTAKSRIQIQSDTDIQKIYSQSATLTHWLFFAEEGRYRKAFFELLQQTYEDRAKPETLSGLTSLSFEELDKKYIEFLQTIPE